MNYTITSNLKQFTHVVFLLVLSIFVSCSELDRDFEDERYLTSSHAAAINEAGGTVGLQALDGAILSYFRDGESSADEFGIKAVDLGMDLRSNDMDMSRDTWFGDYNNYDNIVLTSNDTEFIWEFFYKVINNANGIINTIPDTSPEEILVYKYKSLAYRGIAYFYLIRIYQHTRADDSTEAIPIDFGDFVGEDKSTVGQVKKQVLDDLTAAYNGLESYSRSSKEEVDANVVAAYLARYYLTYENWTEAERFASIAMAVGSIESDVIHGFDELSLSEVIWGAEVTESTSEVYRSFFSHMSQINDGYSGWNHFKTVN
ncbi:MAG: RagB/SusD family nutrient uptake outer membrane protein, partial [Flavobacteriaceae bacterium]